MIKKSIFTVAFFFLFLCLLYTLLTFPVYVEKIEETKEDAQNLIDLHNHKSVMLQKLANSDKEGAINEEEMVEDQLECMRKVKEYSIKAYGEESKMALKAMKKLFLALSKKRRFDEALEEVNYIKEI